MVPGCRNSAVSACWEGAGRRPAGALGGHVLVEFEHRQRSHRSGSTPLPPPGTWTVNRVGSPLAFETSSLLRAGWRAWPMCTHWSVSFRNGESAEHRNGERSIASGLNALGRGVTRLGRVQIGY